MDHVKTLQEVFERFKNAGIRLKRRKCIFMALEVVYLGHKINAKGVFPVKDKVEAIKNAPQPRNVSELKAFLGMLNYYHRFLPNLSTELYPLHELLRKNTKWRLGTKQKKAFQKAKEMLQSDKLLVHFEPNKEIILACDASPYGVGAVLSHKMTNGEEKPIAYASKTLTSAEKKYSQIEKESLAIIFGVKKFHQYIFGRHVRIVTDHKPLIGLFREDRSVPINAASRIQRWALTLAAYEYEIKYKEGRNHGNADGLSRLPLSVKDEKASIPGDTLLLLQHFDETSVTSSKIKRWTLKNALFSRVLHYVKSGWPATCKCPSVEMRPFFYRRNELSCQDDILLWGCRVIIPPEGRKEIIQELHEAHPGISRMKSLATSYVWWPNMDKELEGCVLNCDHCQHVRDKPPEAPMHPWEWPSRPWSRLHVDFAGPFMNKMFMIVVDAHSKWLEVCVMKTITSENTIAKLQQIFSTHGIPDTIVSDNGPLFTSREFKQFLQRNGIKQINSAPYHPASNGLAEKAVQTFKQAMKKMKSGTIQEKINNFLFRYRITPHTTTGASPAELLMKRKLKSKLDLVFPNMEEKVVNKQNIQKHYKDKTAKERDFDLESKVYAKNFSSGDKWLPGYITEKSGPLSYRIRLSDDNIIRRHVDHLRPRQTADPVITPDFEIETSTPSEIKPLEETTQSETTEPRYPKRQKREPAYLKDYVR
ncbi:hypothetical protein FSP39_024398 [Pinctada imbricata]|uniref:Integrase catalytic domain-containing protein n=1 Tax=Pinctada imbricata TaxID=66713 RepID=A0AA88YNY0_PINIB|nr:hypothetical protein FSP39_024398 [Pinctada imbricata]